MIESAALLFREQGYSGTGFRDVIEHSGAPRGSIYHHFPGGKAELAAETVRYAGDVVATRVARTAGDGDPAAALHAYLDWWVRTLEGTDFRAGCPVVAVAVEAQAEPAVTAAAAEAFERWETMFAASLREAGRATLPRGATGHAHRRRDRGRSRALPRRANHPTAEGRRQGTGGRDHGRPDRLSAAASSRQGATSQKPRAAPDVDGTTQTRVSPMVTSCSP